MKLSVTSMVVVDVAVAVVVSVNDEVNGKVSVSLEYKDKLFN